MALDNSAILLITRGVYFVPKLYNCPKAQQVHDENFYNCPQFACCAMKYLKISPFCALSWIIFKKLGKFEHDSI